jgi:Fic family protein
MSLFSNLSLSEKSKKYLQNLDTIGKEIESKRPLTQDELREMQKSFVVSYTYHTNAIEGNTLTLQETKLVIEDGITVGGKPLREIFEASNHKKTLLKLYENIAEKQSFTEEILLQWHKILMENILEVSGEYRDVQVYISGSEEKLPTPSQVPELMQKFFEEYSQISQENIFLRAIWLHWNIAKIHPFIDGNGRIARLLMNFELIQGKNFPVIIPIIRRQEYISSFRSFSDHVELMLDIINENGKDYLRMIS